jgi:hypothetical protein
MAHYAYIDDNNLVVAVVVGKDESQLIDGLDTETYYAQGTAYAVKRTSYNGNIRYNFAGIGYTYDAIRDGFIPPRCHAEATVNNNCLWDCSNEDHNFQYGNY